MSTETAKKEIEVCDKAFALCMDICEWWLNVEKGKLQVISNSLQTCTVIPPAVGVEIAREIIKIFLKIVKVEKKYKRVQSDYIIERNSLMVIIFTKKICALFLQVSHGTWQITSEFCIIILTSSDIYSFTSFEYLLWFTYNLFTHF